MTKKLNISEFSTFLITFFSFLIPFTTEHLISAINLQFLEILNVCCCITIGGCTWDQFRCDNGQCIQVFLKCDRLWHCKDGSDERNCPLSTQIPGNKSHNL